MKSLIYSFSLLLLASLAFFACDNEDDANVITVDTEEVNFGPHPGSKEFTIETNAPTWSITNSAGEWLEVSPTSGKGNSTTVTLIVGSRSLEARTTTLMISGGNAKPVEVRVSQASSTFLHTLTADDLNLGFEQVGGAQPLKVTTDAMEWNASTDADWLEFGPANGISGITTIDVTAAANNDDATRTATITLSATGAPTVEVSVTQQGSLYPNYNVSPIAPDETGMTSTVTELAARINLGWNAGNSLEAIGGETSWGNPKITKALIDAVKQNGFNAVRLPCSFNQYLLNSSTAELKTEWLNRVKEVVQYCVDNDMYVLLNIHWDGGWLENNCTPEKKDQNNAKQRAFWQQIATHLRDFDEHVMFASANEPNVDNATQMAVLSSYHQTFVNAVRETGGKNSYRVLVVQGPSTDIEKTNNLMTTLPSDNVANRLMVEIHYYTPWNFCGLTEDASWGKMFYYWGAGYHSDTDTERNATWGEEAMVTSNFQLMKTKFVDHGVPVIMGEYDATRRLTLTGDALTKHLASRAYFLKYVTSTAKEHGIIPFYWDNGAVGNQGSGIFRRDNYTVSDHQALEALQQGAE
jgi:endoglucanase